MPSFSIRVFLSIGLLLGCQSYLFNPVPLHQPDDKESTPQGAEGRQVSDAFAGSRAGESRKVADIELCWCPPGRFRMGSLPDEPGHRADEAPVEVTLSKGFWIGKYEVTQGQWRRTMGNLPGELNAGVGDDFPVYGISFVESERFCRLLTERAQAAGQLPGGWEFRPPTEAQWEYACRAGSTSAYSRGATLTSADANFGKPYNGTPTGVPGSAASRVGTYPANAWGLHDMHGNEWEWCRDYFHYNLPGGVDPDRYAVPGRVNRDGTSSRVRRGGAWVESVLFCRSAQRLPFEPERQSDHIGLRIVIVRP